MAEIADGGVEAEVAHVGALAETSPSRGELLWKKLAPWLSAIVVLFSIIFQAHGNPAHIRGWPSGAGTFRSRANHTCGGRKEVWATCPFRFSECLQCVRKISLALGRWPQNPSHGSLLVGCFG